MNGIRMHAANSPRLEAALHVIKPSEAHKVDASNLWLGVAQPAEPGCFRATFRIPTLEGRFVELMEVQRQSGIVFAHRVLGVPQNAVFALSFMQLSLSRSSTAIPIPIAGDVEVNLAQTTDNSGRLGQRVDLHFRIRSKGDVVADGSAAVRFLDPRVYIRLRASAGDAAEAQMRQPLTIDGCTVFRPNLSSSIAADHQSDHVPAIALIAAIERASAPPTCGYTLAQLSIQFVRYLELNSAIKLGLRRSTPSRFEGQVVQDGTVAAFFEGSTVGGSSRFNDEGG